MRKVMIAMATCLALAACGTSTPDRATSGAGVGAATGATIGLLGGPVGILVGAGIGAGVGATTGAVTDPHKVNLGAPLVHVAD